jgi:alpha-2-macroglobulin
MKLDLGWLDPRKWNWAALGPAGDYLVAHRTVVIAALAAFVIGSLSGAVFGRATSGGAAPAQIAALAASGGAESPRSANAARAGTPSVAGMAFVRLRTEMTGVAPRACLEFSRPLATDPNVHFSDYIEMDPAAPFQTDVSGELLCLSGLPLEPDRQVTIKEGLPSQDGEKTTYPETFTLTFGDRPAYVGFAGDGVILPRAEADGLAIESVNVSKLAIEVLRVPDRIISQHDISVGETNEEGGWGNWSFDYAGSDVGESIYKGEIAINLQDKRNQAVTTVFALGAALSDRRPGAYVVKVRDASPSAGQSTRGNNNNDSPASAYRWIIYTDMALQTYSGATGIDLVVRSLRTARPLSNVTVTLIAQNNDELARARTDAEGHVRFGEALTKGQGPTQARYVMAYGAEGDFAALDLSRAPLDLSDRGVDGRRTPGDIDAFLYTERGIYRPGERVRLIGLIRDNLGRAIANRQSTLVVYRPNGTEARRIRLKEAELSGAVAKNIDLDRGSPRGQWRAVLEVDGQEAAAGEVSFSVEDFVPQRLRVQVNASEAPLYRDQTRPVSLQADFLYGAPGAGLAVEAEGRLTVDPNPFADQAGFAFGKADENFSEQMFSIPSTVTDGAGHADLAVALSDPPDTSLPLRARIVASVADPGGRVVREGFTIPVRLSNVYFGLKPRFENEHAASGRPVAYELIAVNGEGRRIAARGVQWRLVREDWSYDWYLDGGDWKWRRTGRDIPVDGATIDVAANAPTIISKDSLREGSYRLIITGAGAEASQRFGVGWGGPSEDNATPDMVSVIAPDDPVRPGGRARVTIRPPYAGEAQIVVATDRVIETRTVRVGEGGANIDLPVTADWGSGAYVLVTVMTPRDPAALPVPRRAVGVVYVPVNMQSRTLTVSVGEGLGVVRPRQQVAIPIQVRGAPGGERVRVAIAAVDQGILNLTKYVSPNPTDYFFGRRGLGVDLRDDYGRLLNPNLGAPAIARQGGDSLGGEGLTVVPTKTVSLFSDVVTLDGGGRATIPLTIPDFNGELRLMAVAWSNTAVGQSEEKLTVRDPVVAELILPRFLAPGDEAQAALNVDNVEGPTGNYTVRISGSGAAAVSTPPQRFSLAHGERQLAHVAVTGGVAGIGQIRLRLEGPNGFTPIEHSYDIQSRAPYLPITIVATAPQAAGASWTAPGDALARFQPGDGAALISYSNLAGLDPAPLLDALYRYPYGCSEQLVSVAMPLLYFNTLAADAHAQQDPRLHRRVQEAATQLLDRQNADGAFGLWHAGDRAATPWLGAYVTDFLRRARAAGYAVPAQPMHDAYQALKGVARMQSTSGYQDEVYRWPGSNDTNELLRSRAAAYALYVLAKAGEADIGQVRYYHDTYLDNQPSPLARAQIGAALAHLGDRARASDSFRKAERALGYRNTGDWYQTPLRDLAGVIALAAEAGETDLVDRLRQRIERDAPAADQMMTQEQVQVLLAANALLERAGPVNIALNGEAGAGRHVEADARRLGSGLTFRNDGRGPSWRTLSLSGSPRAQPPAMAAGYRLDKRVFRMDGALADLNALTQGDRVVVVVSGKPDGARSYPTVLVDLLPAGLEIETVLTPADGVGPQQWDGSRQSGPFAWIGEISDAAVAEARDDRFVASRDVRGEQFTFAYIARAVTPGAFAMPAAQVEDMYRPGVMARTSAGNVHIAPRTQ